MALDSDILGDAVIAVIEGLTDEDKVSEDFLDILWKDGIIKKIIDHIEPEISPAGGVTPIGAVLPWLKSLTGTPALSANYVECNGQVLSDAESPYNGETIPNLNGQNDFLYGNSTSGVTNTGYKMDTGDQIQNDYSVVYIIRIK